MAFILSGCLADAPEPNAVTGGDGVLPSEPITTVVSFQLELGEYRVDGAVNNFGLKPNCAHVREGSGLVSVDVEMTWKPESLLADELRVFALSTERPIPAKAGRSPLSMQYVPEDGEAELMFGTGTADEDGLVVAQSIIMTLSLKHTHEFDGEPYAHSCGVGTF